MEPKIQYKRPDYPIKEKGRKRISLICKTKSWYLYRRVQIAMQEGWDDPLFVCVCNMLAESGWPPFARSPWQRSKAPPVSWVPLFSLHCKYSRGEQSLPCIVYLFPLSQITEKFHDSGQATRLNKNVFRLRSLYNEYNQRITTFIN